MTTDHHVAVRFAFSGNILTVKGECKNCIHKLYFENNFWSLLEGTNDQLGVKFCEIIYESYYLEDTDIIEVEEATYPASSFISDLGGATGLIFGLNLMVLIKMSNRILLVTGRYARNVCQKFLQHLTIVIIT